MKLRTIVMCVDAVFLIGSFPLPCSSQSTPTIQMNTANAGVQAADIEAAVATLCAPTDITRRNDGSISGCRVCPEGTDFSHDGHSDWGLFADTPGHFTSPQDDNLLLDGSGCDSHASNFGGSFMFSLKSGKPRLLYYDQGLDTSQCRKFSFPDGRNFLICRGGWTGQGENIANVSMVSFEANGKDVSAKLISTMDSTYTCGDDPDVVVQDSDITDIKFLPSDSGVITGLTITATLGSPKCSDVKSGYKSNRTPAAVKTYQIKFLFDGKHFEVAPASNAALERFESE
jgi:hypothetical protein